MSNSHLRPDKLIPPRASQGGRPTRDVAAKMNGHILEVALAQLVEHGEEHVTMDGIALAAQASKRTLYARFGSRDALVVAAIEHGAARLLQPIALSVPDGLLKDRLLYVAQRMLDASLSAEVVAMEALVARISERRPGLHSQLAAWLHRTPALLIQSLLEQAASKGQPITPLAAEMAPFIYDALVAHPRRLVLIGTLPSARPAAIRKYLGKVLDIILHGVLERPSQPDTRAVRASDA
ncbi:TetR/AcrR family transcriptional regulator [Xanthomonas euroxanthea]|uniref:TetR/AcrR family transcriptional regulator n=1 Tax=Xanthomonas euroxanthea TaxID=2259622 RepID=A0A381LN57_9XANT|nr:TetR/AcrR family transcriptional regulator [Xanthomonas euroxanthea]SYZ51087.1 TetR/AcrR family transcriptional regulator [Xanthomonas arboricola pv. juglandis]MBB5766621.1 AcrR family transcriptional regulator [Xanthomonas euroxanthea]CAD1787082.1 TetR/AcrR family transcriptional regulator [Xanthomonas euroxanthea]CAE1133216.1 TetR/AcrR family transcriptional regulator [Xanthomonas euroxanthea]SUZ26747.1 TetR/AcrR family transcriptional regulator [Xanthomonas euroxanthea]